MKKFPLFSDEQSVKNIMKGLLEGVDHMHKKGIMHRDIKI
jgi:serine/threonine protein kinase